MSKIRIAAVLTVIATLVVSAESYFRKDDPLVQRYELCLDTTADKVEEQKACSDVLMEVWLPSGTRNVVLKHRAYAYRKQREFEKAIADLDEAAALKPDDANTYEMRSGIYLSLEDLERAEQDFQRATSADPTNVGVVTWWVKRMSQLGHFERALAACEQLALADPETNVGLNCNVKPLLNLGRIDEAVRVLKRLAETGSDKEKASAYFFIGRIYLHLDFGKAETLAAFEQWNDMELEEAEPLPALFLAATYLKFGDEEKGMQYIDEVARHMTQEMLDHPFGPWKAIKTALVRTVFRTASNSYFAGLALSMIREYDLAQMEFAQFLELGGPNARSLLINIMVQDQFVPSEQAARSDPRVFARGLERYMTYNGRHFSLNALID